MKRMEIKRTTMQCVLAAVFVAGLSAAAAQTISPPVAEFRGKVSGMYELRNDSDQAMAAILEVAGFNVNEAGVLTYTSLEPGVRVELGSQSFLIPPHQSHMVFYKAVSERPNTWFAILNTLTEAKPGKGGMRINLILPHVVYLYQKRKLSRSDLQVTVAHAKGGAYALRVENRSEKLARVQRVEFRGVAEAGRIPPFPLFPGKARVQTFEAGKLSPDARARLIFEDGLTVEVPLVE